MNHEAILRYHRTINGDARKFRNAYQETLRKSARLLIQAIWREFGPPVARIAHASKSGEIFLIVGDTIFLKLLRMPLYGYLASAELPFAKTASGKNRKLAGIRHLSREIRHALGHLLIASELDFLVESLVNSHANLLLNYLLSETNKPKGSIAERAGSGHHFYPFPGFRTGVNLEQVSSFNTYSLQSGWLSVVPMEEVAFKSFDHHNASQCFQVWSGKEWKTLKSHPMPIHPWKAISDGLSCPQDGIAVIPLISQRTIRVLDTKYDVKLPIDVRLTGEPRLFFELNLKNAVTISEIARSIIEVVDIRSFGIQRDVAAIWPTSNQKWPSDLGAIIREPVGEIGNQKAYCAVEFWDQIEMFGKETEDLPIRIDWMDHYAITLLSGVFHLLQNGVCVEPHLQNTLLIMDSANQLKEIKIRDLDGSILLKSRLPTSCDHLATDLASDTWEFMPSEDIGVRRLCHAVTYGHLYHCVNVLLSSGLVQLERAKTLVDCWTREAISIARLDESLSSSYLASLGLVKNSLKMHVSNALENSFSPAPWIANEVSDRSEH